MGQFSRELLTFLNIVTVCMFCVTNEQEKAKNFVLSYTTVTIQMVRKDCYHLFSYKTKGLHSITELNSDSSLMNPTPNCSPHIVTKQISHLNLNAQNITSKGLLCK